MRVSLWPYPKKLKSVIDQRFGTLVQKYIYAVTSWGFARASNGNNAYHCGYENVFFSSLTRKKTVL